MADKNVTGSKKDINLRKTNQPKLRIAMLGHKRIPSREGGIEVVVEELSGRMVSLGHQVTCFNRRGKYASSKEYSRERKKQYKGIRLKNVFTIDCRGLAAMTSSVSASVCAAFGSYDVVHIHAEGPAFLCWLPKLMKKKVVVTIHGLDHRRAKWGKFASAYIRKGERNAVKYADEIIVLSKGIQSYFKNVYGRDTVYIPNGICSPELSGDDCIRKKFGLEKDCYFLFLGRIVPEKGVKYLIEAFQKVETDKKLVIAGGSSDTDAFVAEMKRLAADDNRILFTGFVQGEVYESIFSCAYVYVLPSDLEGMPLSMLEAMSYGNCCLVSDIPECAEVVGEHGVTFEHGNVEELREAMQKLADDPELVGQYKAGAADYICQKYSWDEVVKETLDLYRKKCG
jgi:glycosyltransferase involved in cell wall biosynthesis